VGDTVFLRTCSPSRRSNQEDPAGSEYTALRQQSVKKTFLQSSYSPLGWNPASSSVLGFREGEGDSELAPPPRSE